MLCAGLPHLLWLRWLRDMPDYQSQLTPRPGKAIHYDIFVQRVIGPILNGACDEPLADLGAKHGMTEKQAGNCLLTAKRACRRLMEEEVMLYAETDAEVAYEIREIFLVLGQ